jgi:ERF superfamily
MTDAQRGLVEMEPSAEIVRTDGASLMAVIAKAAADPATDVDKLERLMALYERITERGAKVAYTQALAAMQPELPVITERGKIIIKEKGTENVISSSGYALWEDINEAIGPILAQHGFALSFRTGMADDGKVMVTGILSHREGHQEQTTIHLPHDSTGSKNAVQAVGSSTSYGKRYTAQALLNLTSRGDDNDAASEGQVTHVSARAKASGLARKSSAQAKRDGDHEKILAELAFCQTEAALDAWYADFDQRTMTMPFSWLDPLRDEVEKRRNQILDALAERV